MSKKTLKELGHDNPETEECEACQKTINMTAPKEQPKAFVTREEFYAIANAKPLDPYVASIKLGLMVDRLFAEREAETARADAEGNRVVDLLADNMELSAKVKALEAERDSYREGWIRYLRASSMRYGDPEGLADLTARTIMEERAKKEGAE